MILKNVKLNILALLILLFGSSNFSSAQNTNDLYQVSYYETWDTPSDSWIAGDSLLLSYYTNGLVSHRIQQHPEYSFEYFYSYDGSGKQTHRVAIKASRLNNDRDTLSTDMNEYDENGFLEKQVTLFYTDGTPNGDSSIISVENIVDNNGNITEQTEMSSFLGGKMVNARRQLYTYDNDDVLSGFELQRWNNDIGAWERRIYYDTIVWHKNSYVKNDKYVSNGKWEHSRAEYLTGFDKDQFLRNPENPSLRMKYEYDDQNNVINWKRYSVTVGGNNFRENTHVEYANDYDSDGHLIEMFSQYYDYFDSSWISWLWFTYADFYEATSLSLVKSDEHQNLFPNPATDKINIKGEVSQVSIYTLQGRKIKTINGKMTNPSIDISSLNQGNYLVDWTLSNGKTVTRQVLIQ